MATSHTKPARIKIQGKPDPQVSWKFFDSDLIEQISAKEVTRDPVTGWELGQFRMVAGGLTFFLARKFGFCYGVKLAIWDSLSALGRHAGKRILALSEMIHNPYVNEELKRRGTVFMDQAGIKIADVVPEDVVIIPAFGTTTLNFSELAELAERGCTLIDTTCRSVIDVWDRIQDYNALGFSSVIHGKHEHEETIATASQANQYLIVRDLDEARLVCDFLRGERTEEEVVVRFGEAMSEGFRPATDLAQIGLANQTTMRSSESEEVFALFRETLTSVYGEDALHEHYQGLDTICRATEVRQQAVIDMCSERDLDLMVVVGGHNSSNTKNLAKISGGFTRTYHIEGEWSFDGEEIRHLLYGASETTVSRDWLPASGRIGITAGASTPDNTMGEVIEKILALRPQA